MIIDQFNRAHDYLRISLTDKCDLRCFYCMPEEDYEFAPMANLMQVDEIIRIASSFAALGVKKIRLTGGEPLIRKDADKILLELAKLPVELTLTTNGTRLHHFTTVFREAGIRSVNISLDTLNHKKFSFFTRRDQFEQVIENIRLMMTMGFHVKINVVVLKERNANEIPQFIEWTRDEDVHVRFIEFMPFTGNQWNPEKVFTWKEMLEIVGRDYKYVPLVNGINDTAKKYRIPGYKGTFAVISTMSAPFCSSCNRMRLTADGKMKNCLFSNHETDLLATLRRGEDIVPLIRENVFHKKEALGGQMTEEFGKITPETIKNRSMIAIGG